MFYLSLWQQELKGNEAGEEEYKVEWFAKTPESEKEVGRYPDGYQNRTSYIVDKEEECPEARDKN